MYIKIVGLGAAVPSNRIENSELPEILNTNDEWITTRTGIKSRYHANGTQTTSVLAYEAAKAAIESNSAKDDNATSIDTLILATTTPDRLCPATAPKVAHALKLGEIGAFDINAVCSGFVYGLQLAEALIKSKKSKKIMLIGADTFSSILNVKDRATFPLFGDAAAAIILEASHTHNNLLDTITMSDGAYEDFITVKNGGSESKLLKNHIRKIEDDFFTMRGREIFTRAIKNMGNAVTKILEKNKMHIDNVDYLVPHQANLRIIDSLSSLFDIGKEKILTSLEEYGNTSAASIPLTLVKSCIEGKIKENDKIVMTAFGGGLTWGAGLIEWPETNFNTKILFV